MKLTALLVLAVGLSMDAMAVSAARGVSVPTVRLRHALLVAGLFGGFQAAMPLIGWFIGVGLASWVAAWDHWVAFALLAGIGGKMCWESTRPVDDSRPGGRDAFAFGPLLVLAVATSIDALAAGITLPLLGAPLALSLGVIGLTTAALSVAGLFLGRRLGSVIGPRLDLLGGLVLIALGGKILVEHLGTE